MRTSHDAIMSVKRYMAVALGAEWEVRLWSDEGSFAPPVARVAEASPTLVARHGRVAVEVTQALQVHCYTEPADTVSGSLVRARAVEELLHTAIEVGVGEAWPRRIPLYDYDGIDAGEPSTARNYYDFLRVADFSVNRIEDSEDATLVVVVADVRVRWSRATTIDPGTGTVESLRVEERAS
jgi:hypothetical protein